MDNYNQKRLDKYKEDSRDRLSKIIKKKIETTMVGAISSMEKHFGFLWGQDEDGPLTEDQREMKKLFLKMREDIFDKGNHQARNIDVELSQYNIEWKRYSLKLPVKNKE